MKFLNLICVVAVVLKSTTADRCLKDLVPLYRLYNPTSEDHFYTTSLIEADNAANSLGYRREGSPGLVSATEDDCRCRGQCECKSSFDPVYRLYKPGQRDDHFYTLSESEADNAATNLGYIREGIAFYCVAKLGKCGASLSFHRYFRLTDHFYTTDLDEGSQNVIVAGGKYEGILCNIWPVDTSANNCQKSLSNLVPLNRLYRPSSGDHFYTTSVDEADNAANSLGYRRERSPGLVATTSSDCQCGNSFVPVYRLYKPGKRDDHFYTTDENEATNAANKLGYRRETKWSYYCASDLGECGASLPLYRYWRGTDHFYTTDLDEGNKNVIAKGGVYQGILCYIWAPPNEGI